MENFFLFQPTIIDIDRYDGVLLLNEQGDLYILLHNIGVQITPFKSKKCFKIYRKERKISLATYTEPLTQGSKLLSRKTRNFSVV